MARFILICQDRPGALALRMATREAHLAHVADNAAIVRAAGPLLDEDGAMTGSLFVLEASDAAAVDAFTAADPYRLAGLFETTQTLAWRQTVGAPI
jgi:uncharacterized protein YciI